MYHPYCAVLYQWSDLNSTCDFLVIHALMDCGLQIHTQEVHLLQLLPSGRFLVLHHLGKHCWDDDDMTISEQVDAEARWRRTQVRRCSIAWGCPLN